MSCPKCKVEMEKKTVRLSKDFDLGCLKRSKCEGIWVEKAQVDWMKEQILAKIRKSFYAGER